MESGAPVIVVANESGGCGKTTTSSNLAAALALGGLRVVVIDGDQQGDLSYAVGVQLDGEDLDGVLGFAEAIEAAAGGEQPLPEWLLPTGVEGLRVLVGGEGLVEIKDELSDARAEGEDWVADAIRGVARMDDVDVVVVDTPPSSSAVTIGALLAADVTLAVVGAWKFTSLPAHRKLLRRVEILAAARGGSGQARVVLQGHKRNRVLHTEMLEALEGEAGGVFAVIPYAKSGEESPVSDVPLILSDRDSTAAYKLADLASDVLREVQTIRGEAA